MTLEIPVLRLGLAGFTARQKERAESLLASLNTTAVSWCAVDFPGGDAWWVDGSRSVVVEEGVLLVGAGEPQAPSVHLNMRDADRPLAFARPLPPPPFEAAFDFDLASDEEALAILARFTGWLRPLAAQLSLAACLFDQHAALGAGCFRVMNGSRLVAIVDMHGDVSVLPTATTADFEDAMWRRTATRRAEVPSHFARVSLSQLMWQFATRATRDLLPPHYRTGLIYFRRPPKLAQRALTQAHHAILRELSMGCALFDELQHRTQLPGEVLARELAALYLVGAITSNPRRAATGALRRLERGDSVITSPDTLPARLPAVRDTVGGVKTAPASRPH